MGPIDLILMAYGPVYGNILLFMFGFTVGFIIVGWFIELYE